MNFYQIVPFSYETQVLLQLLKIVADEPLYHNLRTIEQLAYSVSFKTYKTHNILGYKIGVDSQETKFTAEYIDERIENFRHILLTTIESMSDVDFDAMKGTLVRNKTTAFNELSEEVNNNWTEITTNQYEFDRRHKEIEHLATVTKLQLLGFYRMHYGQNERKLSIQIIGNAQINETKKDGTIVQPEQNSNSSIDELSYVDFNGESKGYLIHDFMAFKDSLEVYPVEKIN